MQNFLIEFQMKHKTPETVHTTDNILGLRTPSEHEHSPCENNKFFGRDELLKMRSMKHEDGQQLKVVNDPLSKVIETHHLTATKEVINYIHIDHSMVIAHLKQIGNDNILRN